MDNREVWVALCAECDALLNAMVLRFLRIPDGEMLIEAYRRSKGLTET